MLLFNVLVAGALNLLKTDEESTMFSVATWLTVVH